jgi:hypothetical protein
VLTPAPAEALPTVAFTPIPHAFLQHFSSSFLQDPQPSQQHPDVTPAMTTTITTIMEFIFMNDLTFFTCVVPETIPGRTGK